MLDSGINDAYKNIIYAVCDPESYSPIYIGKSTTGIDRPLTHIKEKSHSETLNNWTAELGKKGQAPIIIVLESTSQETLLIDKEKYWIKKYSELGYPLLNKTNNVHKCVQPADENKGIDGKSQLLEIGNFVRQNRLFRKLTQEELGKETGLSRSTINIVEHGEHMAMDSVIKLLGFFLILS